MVRARRCRKGLSHLKTETKVHGVAVSLRLRKESDGWFALVLDFDVCPHSRQYEKAKTVAVCDSRGNGCGPGCCRECRARITKLGEKAERKNNYDAAFQAYKKAHRPQAQRHQVHGGLPAAAVLCRRGTHPQGTIVARCGRRSRRLWRNSGWRRKWTPATSKAWASCAVPPT